MTGNPQDDQQNKSVHSSSSAKWGKMTNRLSFTRNSSLSKNNAISKGTNNNNSNSNNKTIYTSSSKSWDISNDEKKQPQQHPKQQRPQPPPEQRPQPPPEQQQQHPRQQQQKHATVHSLSEKPISLSDRSQIASPTITMESPPSEIVGSNCKISTGMMQVNISPSMDEAELKQQALSTYFPSDPMFHNHVVTTNINMTTKITPGGSVQTNPNQATTAACAATTASATTRTNSTMSSGSTTNHSENGIRKDDETYSHFDGSSNTNPSQQQQQQEQKKDMSFWGRVAWPLKFDNAKSTTIDTPCVHDDGENDATTACNEKEHSNDDEPVSIPFLRYVMCTTPLGGTCIPLSEAFGGVFSSYTETTNTNTTKATTTIDDHIIDEVDNNNIANGRGGAGVGNNNVGSSSLSAPYSNLSASSPPTIRPNNSTVTVSTSAAVKAPLASPLSNVSSSINNFIEHTLSDKSLGSPTKNTSMNNDQIEVSRNHEVSITTTSAILRQDTNCSHDTSNSKKSPAMTVMEFQKLKRQQEEEVQQQGKQRNSLHQQQEIQEQQQEDYEKTVPSEVIHSSNTDPFNKVDPNTNNNNENNINNNNISNANKGIVKKSKYSSQDNNHPRQQQQQPPVNEINHDEEMERVKAAAPAPFAILTLGPKEVYAMERNVSELTMRSSYASTIGAANQNSNNIDGTGVKNGNPNKNVNTSSTPPTNTNSSPENRRMAYYAVGQHFHLNQRGNDSNNKKGGNRRCYFTGKLILGGAPFYAGCVQQGLRTLVVFCLPSALCLPDPNVIAKYRADHLSSAINNKNNNNNSSKLFFPSLVKSTTSGSQSIASRNSGANRSMNRRGMGPTLRLDMSNNSGGGGGGGYGMNGRIRSRKAFSVGGASSVATGSQYSQSQVTSSSRVSRFTMTGGSSSYHTNDERTVGTSVNSIESELDPNWNIDNQFLLNVLPPAGTIVLEKMSSMHRDQFETLPVQVRDSTRWKLYIKFCFFSGLPISQDEVHYKIRDDIANDVYFGEEIVLSHEVMEAAVGSSSAELLTLPNTNVTRYIKRHYVQQCSKLGTDQRIFQRASWERISPEV